MTTIGGNDTWIDRVFFFVVIGAMILLFIVLSRPAWDGENMKNEFISDCKARGGVLLVHQKMFGTSYECASRLDGKQAEN